MVGTLATPLAPPLSPPRPTVTASLAVAGSVTTPFDQRGVGRYTTATVTRSKPVRLERTNHPKRVKRSKQPEAHEQVRRSLWDVLAGCESSGNWSYNGGSGYDGGLQFSPSTWLRFKPSSYPRYAYLASRVQQIFVAVKVEVAQGLRQAWPACSRQLGLVRIGAE